MKKAIFIISIFLLNSCVFTYDPALGLLNIENNSDEAVYVYHKCGDCDSLSLIPKLELFEYFNNEDNSMIDASGSPLKSGFVSPEYRINAYQLGSITISGSRRKPRLPCNENKITLFFITEKTMRDFSWEEIYKNQMFVSKITLTNDELENENWKYTYSDKCLYTKPN